MSTARVSNIGWAAAYLLLAVFRLAPLSLDPARRLADDGDAFLVTWIVWWGSTHLGLGYPGIFSANAFFPHPDALLYAEPMLAQALLGWPLFRFAEPVLAINLLTIATFALSAFGFHLLAREWTGSDGAALVGALLYAFNSYTLAHVARLQLVSLGWMPLALLALHRFALRGERKWAVAFAALSLLHGLSCLYYLVFYAFVLALLAPPLAWRTRAWRSPGPLAALLLASAVAIALLALVAVPYADLYRRYGFVASEDPFDLVLYLTPSVDSPWYAGLGAALRPPGYFVDFFLGFVALALAAIGFVAGARDRSQTWPGPATWIAVAVLAVIGVALSAGTDVYWRGERVGTGPFAWLSSLGPFARMREPRRLAAVVAFAVALLAARGAAALCRRLPGRRGAVASVVLAALAAGEHVSPSRSTAGVEVPSGDTIPEVYRWLAAHPGEGPLAELPPWPRQVLRYMAVDQYFSTVHGQTITTGWASFPPPALERLIWAVRNFPDAESLTILRGLGVRLAVIHPRRWDEDRRFHLRRLAEREDVLPLRARFEERNVPIWSRYKLGGEEVRSIERPLDERPARACACAEIPRQAYRVDASVGTPLDAVDGSTRTHWSTGGAQQRGMWFEVAFDRRRRVARVEVEMAHPYGEFARHLRIVGDEGGEPIEMGPLPDVAYELQLLKQLVRDPRGARLRYDLRPAMVQRIRLEIAVQEDGAPPWSLPEVHVFEGEPLTGSEPRP